MIDLRHCILMVAVACLIQSTCRFDGSVQLGENVDVGCIGRDGEAADGWLFTCSGNASV
jgi:hypothetical protein